MPKALWSSASLQQLIISIKKQQQAENGSLTVVIETYIPRQPAVALGYLEIRGLQKAVLLCTCII